MRISEQLSTGKFLEGQSNASAATLIANAVARGYAANDVSTRLVSSAEFETIIKKIHEDDDMMRVRRPLPATALRLRGGTATPGSAALTLEPGTLLETPELGTLEYVDDGTTGHLYFTLHVGGVTTRIQIA